MINFGLNRLRAAFIVSILAVASACSITRETSIPSSSLTPTQLVQVERTATPVFVMTATSTVSSSRAASPTLTLTPTPSPTLSLLNTLPHGQFVVYSAVDNYPAMSFYVVSMDGVLQGRLATGRLSSDATLSSNGKQVAFSTVINLGSPVTLLILDLDQNTFTEAPVEPGCRDPSWAPDGIKLAFTCKGINMLSFQNETTVSIVSPPPEPGSGVHSPEWSPDGKWIAYYIEDSLHHSDGPYFVDASCLSDPLTCNNKTFRFANLAGVLEWSPDSQHLAIAPTKATDNLIRIFDVQSGEVIRELEIWDLGLVTSMAWSPDGKWIAYKQSGTSEIFLIMAEGGQPIRLYEDNTTEDQQVVFWLTIP